MGACRQEFPIIDGIPIVVPDVRSYLHNNQSHIFRRGDFSADLVSLFGDAIGPGTDYDQTRQHLSIYCWGHYADLDPEEHDAPGAMGTLLKECLSLAVDMTGPGLDLGCSVGRSTFELACHIDGPVLGTDLNFAMLQKAQQVLGTGRLSYDRRRVGVVYDERAFPVHMPAAGNVDFWACDALALPFEAKQFGAALALNLFDCVSSPRDLLAVIGGMLRKGASAVIATPYDWSVSATPVEAWIGGHSQRGEHHGAAEPLLRALLTPGGHPQSVEGLVIAVEADDLVWETRLHDRSRVSYVVHVVVAKAS